MALNPSILKKTRKVDVGSSWHTTNQLYWHTSRLWSLMWITLVGTPNVGINKLLKDQRFPLRKAMLWPIFYKNTRIFWNILYILKKDEWNAHQKIMLRSKGTKVDHCQCASNKLFGMDISLWGNKEDQVLEFRVCRPQILKKYVPNCAPTQIVRMCLGLNLFNICFAAFPIGYTLESCALRLMNRFGIRDR